MDKRQELIWHFVKNISKKWYFWPLIGLFVLGLVLDIHSTYLCVVKMGIAGEMSPVLVFLFHRFALLGLGVRMSIFLALILSKILILVVVSLGFLAMVWITPGDRTCFGAFLFIACSSIFIHVIYAFENYYNYFFAIMR